MRISAYMKRARVYALALAVILISANAAAAEIPNFEKPISMAAREQPVADFFAELFGHLGVPVKVDAGIAGSVNGDFQGTAHDIYRDVEKAFQLTMYYDSSKVYIYSSDQLSRKIIPMSEKMGKMVLRNAKKMRVGDSLNKAVWSDMGLVVTGTDRYRSQIDSYTKALRSRSPTPTTQPAAAPEEIIKVFKLKYAWADDTTIVSGGQELLVRGVATLLRTVVETGMVGVEQNSGSQRTRVPRTEQGLRGSGLQSVGRDKAGDMQGRKAQSDQSLATSQLNRSPGSARSSEYMSSTRIVADPLNNAVIIRDRADRMQNYQDLINSLDIEPRMVEIEATIIDMDTDRLRALGIDWRLQDNNGQGLFGNAVAASAGELNSSAASFVDGLSAFTQNVLNSKVQFLTRIRALEQQKAARIVSKPHVMTLANVEALLDTTSTFFVRVAGREEVDLFNVSVGTTMRVTPHVFEQGGRSQIKLKIDIVDGNQASQQVDGIPVIDESTINTQAIINAGQSLLIGGLVREFKNTNVTKVPLLGSIPGVGALFRNTNKSTSRVERMFLITPRLSTQAPAGKRYSVPILAGSEAQIIESGPSRLEPTLAGLASRDEAFPLRQSLPIGSANVGLTVPNQPLPDPSRYPSIPIQSDGAGTATVPNQRLLQNSDNDMESVPYPSLDYQPIAPDSMIVTAPMVEAEELEWQSVAKAKPAPVVKAIPLIAAAPVLDDTEQGFAAVAAKKRASADPLLLDDAGDGWAEVPRLTLRKTVRSSAVRQPITVSDDAGWSEIK